MVLSLPDGLALRPLGPADLTAYDAGRNLREPGQALRDLLGAVDGGRCRFPSCTRRRKLHAHHVRWWSDGGATDLANLVLLGPRHHALVHSQRFQLVLHPVTRALTVTTQDGTAIPHHPPLPWPPAGELDPTSRIGPAILPPTARDKLDVHYAVAVLLQHAA